MASSSATPWRDLHELQQQFMQRLKDIRSKYTGLDADMRLNQAIAKTEGMMRFQFEQLLIVCFFEHHFIAVRPPERGRGGGGGGGSSSRRKSAHPSSPASSSSVSDEEGDDQMNRDMLFPRHFEASATSTGSEQYTAQDCGFMSNYEMQLLTAPAIPTPSPLAGRPTLLSESEEQQAARLLPENDPSRWPLCERLQYPCSKLPAPAPSSAGRFARNITRRELLALISQFVSQFGMNELQKRDPLWRDFFLGQYLGLRSDDNDAAKVIRVVDIRSAESYQRTLRALHEQLERTAAAAADARKRAKPAAVVVNTLVPVL